MHRQTFGLTIAFSIALTSYANTPQTADTALQAEPIVTTDEFDTKEFAQLLNIDLDDGVSEQEAEQLAFEYFTTFINGCGFPDDLQSNSTHWYSRPRVGFAGTPADHLIHINKTNGRIYYAPAPHTMQSDPALDLDKQTRVQALKELKALSESQTDDNESISGSPEHVSQILRERALQGEKEE